MKKSKYLLFALVCAFCFSISVGAETIVAELGFCEEKGILETFRLIGYGLYILKILIPLIIIILGMIDFTKAVIASDDSTIKKSASALIKRAIAGVIIFLAPTIVGAIFTLVEDQFAEESNYTACMDCLTDPSGCAIPKN